MEGDYGPWARTWKDGWYDDDDLLGVGLSVDEKCDKMVVVCKAAKEAMG
jgi:hypothetical protein